MLNRLVCGVILASVIVTANAQAAILAEYDASLGSLPEAQGWDFVQVWRNSDTGASIPPEIVGDSLYQQSLIPDSVQKWAATGFNIDFMESSPIVYEATLKVASSEYATFTAPDRWRAGYGLTLTDRNQRHLIVGILPDGFALTNDPNWEDINSTAFVDFNTTGAFNDFRLEVADGVADLFVNDVFQTSILVGAEYTHLSQNSVQFGDVSLNVESETYLRNAKLTYGAVPEPTTLAIWGVLGGLGLVAARRRKKTA